MSDELNPHIEAVRALKVDWDERRSTTAERGMNRKRRQRRIALSVLATASVAAAAFFVFAAPEPDVIVAPLSSRADVRVLPREDHLEVAQLTAGGAWFEVRPNPNRTFRVEAGDVTVEVLGTRFAVERAERGVRVLVDHGRVRVKWKNGERILTNGDDAWFPTSATPDEVVEVPVQAALPTVASVEPEPVVEVAVKPKAKPKNLGPSWQELANSGDQEAAFIALQKSPPPDGPAGLLLAADVARLSRHPESAVAPLKQLLAQFPKDGRAPLAAFTLGRVLLDQLSQPAAAAEAFARARALDPKGPLAEDALARNVGAAALSGNRDEATRLATEYLALFPEGRSVRSVKHYGGMK